MTKILVTVPIDFMPRVTQTLESVGEVTYLDNPTREELMSIIEDYDAVFTNTFNYIGEELLVKAKNLRLVETPSTGTDHIDIQACKKHGVEVQSLTYDFSVLENIPSTAELAVALMLTILRNMKGATNSVINGKWDYTLYRGREIQGLNIGIVGYGRLGKIFAKLISGFKPNILVYDPYVKVDETQYESIRQVSLDEILAEAEVISIHVHLREDTKHMFNKETFGKMKRKPYIINTSRGGIIKSEDLVWALENNYVSAAGLDVIEGEVDYETGENVLINYARENDNLVITPHMGGMTYEAQNKAFLHAATKLRNFFVPKEG